MVARQDTWHLTGVSLTSAVAIAVVDLFNALGTGKKLTIIRVDAFNGSGAAFGQQDGALFKTTTVGTAGAVIAPVPADTTQVALPAGVTARTLPTGGAAGAGIALARVTVNDGTFLAADPSTIQEAPVPMYQIVPDSEQKPIVCNPGEGVKIAFPFVTAISFLIIFTIA